MRQRIDISEVEAETKIRAKYLRALENEEWNLLPGPTYVKSFLRTYADALGLDGTAPGRGVQAPPRAAVRHRAAAHRPAPGGRRGAAAAPPTARAPALARSSACVVLGLVAALWLLGRGGSNDGTATAPPRSTPTTTTPGAGGASATTAAERRRRRQRRAAAARIVRLQVLPSGPVFVCLVDARSRQLIPGSTLQAGAASRTFRSSRAPRQPGNSNVRLRINGHVRAVPPSSSAIGYEITRSAGARRSRWRSARPAGSERMPRGHRRHRHRGPHRAASSTATARGSPSGCASSASTSPHTVVVGDRPADIAAALRWLAAEGMDRSCTSGGLGPTADDLTAEVVADVPGRPLALDEALEERIGAIVEPLRERWPRPRPRRAARRARASRRTSRRARRCSSPSAPPPASSSRPPTAATARPSSCCPGPPRELQADVGGRGRDRRLPGRDRGRDDLPRSGCCACSGSPSPRSPRRCGSRPRERGRPRRAGDHDLPAARRGRGRHALRAGRASPRYDALRGRRPRAPRRHALLRRRLDDRRAGRAPAARARLDDRHRRVVHRRPARRRA